MTLNFSMNREMLKRCIRQLLVTVVTMMFLHGQRARLSPMVTGVPRTSCVIIMSPAGPGQQIDSNWQPLVNVAVFLRIFCETGSVTRSSDVERRMVVTKIRPLSITCSLSLVISGY